MDAGSHRHMHKHTRARTCARAAQIDITEKALEINILQKDGDVARGPVQLENIKGEVAVAVCFCPAEAEATPTTVRLVGSSCVKSARKARRASKELWDDDNAVGINDKAKGGVGMEELNPS